MRTQGSTTSPQENRSPRQFVLRSLYAQTADTIHACTRPQLAAALQRWAVEAFGVHWDHHELSELVDCLWRDMVCFTQSGEMLIAPVGADIRVIVDR